jgi:hypothetical protein
LTPNLFKLAHFKRRTMQQELHNKNWIHAVRQISTSVELHEFLKLWQLLREVSLNQGEPDEIRWRWMPNGEYIASSAYQVQFKASHPSFQTGKLWKVRTELKVKIFGWTSINQKNLTADNLALRGIQHNL